MDPIRAWHFTDPGCPWAYSFGPALARLRWRFGEQVEWRTVVIGLSETPAGGDAIWRTGQARQEPETRLAPQSSARSQ